MQHTNLADKEGCSVYRFDSPEAYGDYLSKVSPQYHDNSRTNWAGRSVEQSIRTLTTDGDTANVPAAQKILDQVMSDETIFTSGLPLPVDHIVGYEPNVPNAIIGLPKSMVRREISDTCSITTPLSIYIDVGVSECVTIDQLRNRGVAILALAMALQITRPIDIYVFTAYNVKGAYNYQIACTKIDNRPIDLGRACYCLTDPSFNRRLGFTFAYSSVRYNSNGYVMWAFSSQPTENTYQTRIRELLGITDQDLFFMGGYIYDKLMLNNPVAWVKQQVEKHNQRSEEGM